MENQKKTFNKWFKQEKMLKVLFIYLVYFKVNKKCEVEYNYKYYKTSCLLINFIREIIV